MECTKALIIGLGSTGAEICSKLAERISWEMQIQPDSESLRVNVPWVRFLCIETNASGKPRNIQPEDFLTLTISADKWHNILAFSSAYDEAIEFQQWADIDTLKLLHDNSIHAGAGNIRMVGRLAFLYPENFDKVHLALNTRLTDLQSLDSATANERLPEAFKQHNPPVKLFFTGNGGQPVIYVVGTLCGGTCSGIVSDFGFFLRSKTADDQYKIGFFTLPRKDLVATIDDRAERLKKNAYAALVELNQYYYTSEENRIEILFPDKTRIKNTSAPYDYLFIAHPRALGAESVEQLHTAIADCIFLQIFAPQTLPMAMGVDAAVHHETLKDADYQSHVFCTFGLSTLEFPAQRIANACTYRFASYVLSDWLHSAPSIDFEARARAIVGSWSYLVEQLKVQSRIVEVIKEEKSKKGRWNIRSIEEAIEEESKSISADIGTVQPEVIREIAQQIVTRLEGGLRECILDSGGNLAASRLLDAVQQELASLRDRAQMIAAGGDFFESVPPVLEKLHQVTGKKSIFSRIKPQEVLKWLDKLADVWTDGLINMAQYRLARALLDNGNTQGILTRVENRVQLYRSRLSNMEERILLLKSQFDKQESSLSTNPPAVNGEVIWEHDLVDTEYQHSFVHVARQSGDPMAEWTTVRQNTAKQVIREVMQPLANDIVKEPYVEDWLLMPLNSINEDELLPRNIYNHLLTLCRKPFARLQDINVLDRWARMTKRDLVVQKMWDKASRFLDLDVTQASAGGFPDIHETQTLLRPNSDKLDDFESFLATQVRAKWLDSPTLSRVVVANYSFRFPLRGVPSVTGAGGLAFSSTQEKRLFFSRKDVAWIGLTEEEQNRIRTAEMLVAIGLLLGIVVPQNNCLEYDTGTETPSGKLVTKLPLSIRKAAVSIASPESSINLMNLMKAHIEEVRSQYSDGEWDIPFLDELVSQLRQHRGAAVPDWDKEWLGRQIARYCAQDEKLRKAYSLRFPPAPAIQKELWHKQGDKLVKGQIASHDGYYCNRCGGLIGATEADAAAYGWRCRVNSNHDFRGLAGEL